MNPAFYGGGGDGILDTGYGSAGTSLSVSPLLIMSVGLIMFYLFDTASSHSIWAPPGGRCGADFNASCKQSCCSGAGYCGTTEEFCSVPGNCQEAFGWCDSFIMPKGVDVSHGTRKYASNLPAKIDKCTVPKTLALTFDDGPSNYTGALLDTLRKHNARATFFVAGVNNGHGQLDIRWKDTVRRMILDGHQVGSHTWSHPNLDKLSSAARKMEMYKTERSIINIIGKMPTFMRPPMVICGDQCMKDMKELAYHVVGWQVDSQDWHDPQPSVEETTIRLVNEMNKRDNMFLIQHDTSQTAIDVLDNVLNRMPSEWKAVPLVECLGHSLDHAFQHPEWLEYNDVAARGCLTSGPASCFTSKPFHDRKSCFDVAITMKNYANMCHFTEATSPKALDLMRPAKEHCFHTGRLADATMKFCKQCKSDKECDSNLLKYKGL